MHLYPFCIFGLYILAAAAATDDDDTLRFCVYWCWCVSVYYYVHIEYIHPSVLSCAKVMS
jgi:hypothetical protein